MTVREEAKWCIQQDGMLAEIRKKIRSGKATYEDTAAYSARAGKMIGALFSRRLPEIPPEEREQLCVELLHDQYIDINAAVDAAQRYLDEKLGIQLAPQHAPFDSERGHQIGSSLRDPSKPVKTLQRRAKAATETTVKSMHDDRMKTEAKFRSRAGLKCTVNRIAAAKCCEWCDQVAGKYAYEDTPPDLWRRHDNCNCTIVYGTRRDRQVLRGTEKKWEIVAEGVGAPEPVRLTPEQAKELQEKHQLKRLTNGRKDGIIKSREVKPMIRAIEQPIEQQHTGKGNPNAILTFDVELNNRQAQLLEQLPDFDSRVTVPKSSVNMSDLSALTAKTGQEFAMFTKGQERLIIRGDTNSVNIDIDTARQLATAGYRWSGHTHPGDSIQSMIASGGDMLVLEQFPQSTSVIYNSKGQYATFGKEE